VRLECHSLRGFFKEPVTLKPAGPPIEGAMGRSKRCAPTSPAAAKRRREFRNPDAGRSKRRPYVGRRGIQSNTIC